MNSLRRSLHFVPGNNERMFSKALELPADSLILDLEDSVPPDRKKEARKLVGEWLSEADFAGREKLVRINALGVDGGRDDLEAIMQSPPDGIVVPKVTSLADVEALDRLLLVKEKELDRAAGTVPLLVIGTEQPLSVMNLSSLLRHPRIEAAAWGAEDLATALGARSTRDAGGDYLEVFQAVRSWCLLAAVAAGVQPVDAPYVDYQDSEGLQRECALTAAMGFTGKLTIHPAQVEIVNAAFSPTAEEVAHAMELVEAAESAAAQGRLAFALQGRMVDRPHLEKARRLIARASLINEKSGAAS